MSHTNETVNYRLPQFVTSDKPAWLTDINNAYVAIDSAIHTAQTKADTAQNDATQALTNAGAAATAAAGADAKGGGAIASIADTFDATTVYAVGDKVMYNSLLYICTNAIITPGPWTGSANWSRITVEGMINDLSGDNIPVNNEPDADPISTAIENLQLVTNNLYVINKNSTVMTAGSTWQIPAAILSRRLVIIEAHRYGYGGSIIIPTEFITAGAYNAGFTIGRQGYAYTFSISATGLLTLVNLGGSGEPSVCAIGVL